MYNILTLNKISKFGLEKLDSQKYICGDSVENPDAIMVRSASMHESELNANLLAVARAGAGVNNIPIERCSENGVVVFNTPGANANAVKELVLCALLLSSRKIGEAIDWCKTLKGEGDAVGKLVEKGKSAFAGPEISGKTLGIMGLGAIGVLVANAAIHLGMDVVGYDPYLSVDGALSLNSRVKVVTDQAELFASSDYISLHLPLNSATKGMINSNTIETMKDGIRILNFARGELVNSADIISALETGKAAAYVTDFPTDEQIGAKGVIAIPHLGASTPESEDNCAVMAAKELANYLEKGIIKNSVNFPRTQLSLNFTKRVCVIHKEDDALVSSLSKILGNVSAIASSVKNGYGYTVADVSEAPDLEAIQALDCVIKVRVI